MGLIESLYFLWNGVTFAKKRISYLFQFQVNFQQIDKTFSFYYSFKAKASNKNYSSC